uniref:NB-ARC domain-containing protein n=1 Tax=Oryza punctata TaxID=4537 RepID=A0A0E0JWY4_ORYPU
MASEAIVSGVVADMVGRLVSLVAGQLRDRRGDVEEKLRRVRRLVVRIESAVEAAEARRITGRALLAWLSELVDGAHQGRYFLDAFPVVTDHDDGGGGGGRGEVAVANPLNPAKRLRVAARRLVFWDGGAAAELDGVLADLESVSGDLTGFITMLQSCPPALHRPLNTNIYADSQMFGRQVERRRVFDFLLQDGDGEQAEAELAVLSIVGCQGLGKTTLVQHVCNDLEVRRRFSLIIELDFHCLSLMAAGETALLLRSMFTVTGGTASTTSVFGDGGETLTLLERKLRGVRFLAVFDSVDERRRRVIDAIMPTLRRGQRGSKVIVTSRHAKHVAGLATAADTITLRPPPPAEYWLFFKAHAFGGADAEADPQLVAAGQAIAKRLRLAASFFGGKMLAALLRSRPDLRFWRTVLSSGAADLPCLGYADDVVAGRLFPPHVTLQSVTMSRSPERGIVSLQDSCLITPPTESGDRRRCRSPELPVLLCKSVFPSYCIYYTAHCTISDIAFQISN